MKLVRTLALAALFGPGLALAQGIGYPASPAYDNQVPPPVAAESYGLPGDEGYQSVYGQPSAIPEPIRAPSAVNTAEVFGYDDLGRQGFAEGDAGKAEFNFEKALEVNPFDPVALNNLSVARAERGQFHEAMGLLERAAKLDPNNADVAANLARLRGYVQGYAMAGMEPLLPQSASGPLPPAPPGLWAPAVAATAAFTDASYLPPPAASTTFAQPAVTVMPSDYYVSEACTRKPAKGQRGKVDIDCEPR